MIDLKYILGNIDEALARLHKRDPGASLDALLDANAKRRELTARHNELRHEQKTLSRAFGKTPKEQLGELRAKLKAMSDEVKELEQRVKEAEEGLQAALLDIPNLPLASVPAGQSEGDNVVVRTWGEPKEHDFDALQHDELGARLGIVDFEAGARISGAGFVTYRGLGARLERALASFMLDTHTGKHGYEELLTPFIVRREAMVGTGQLPKFEEDAYRIEPDDMFLIPTAEVPLTNIHRETVLDADELPKRSCAFSPCFRREAGSYGRDTKGLTRLHQFQKVELVQVVAAEDSEAAHEALTSHAEAILQALGLPYRVVSLCGGDLGFSAAKCYDLEVWLPVQQRWREISSCSNFLDFQARRANIRYRPGPGAKPRYAHTINGSGLAVGRTVMAIMEVYQTAEGAVAVPEVLRPYMGTDVIR